MSLRWPYYSHSVRSEVVQVAVQSSCNNREVMYIFATKIGPKKSEMSTASYDLILL